LTQPRRAYSTCLVDIAFLEHRNLASVQARRRVIPVVAFSLAASGLLACGANHQGAARKPGSAAAIKVGTNRALGTVTPYVARTKGYFQRHGEDVDIVDFSDGSTLMEAFASGQLDIALLGIAPSAIWHAKGVGLKVVASANGGGHVLLTRADSGITDLRGLKGKKVATPKPGTVTDTLFRAEIVKELARLDSDKDVQIVPDVAPADMPTALFVSREVDAAITWEPFASQAEARFKNAKVLFDGSAEWRKSHASPQPLYPVNVVIARQSFIDSRPGDLRSFLAAYVDAIRFINSDPQQANPIIAKEVELDETVVAAARQRIDYTAQIDPEAGLKTLEWSKTLGYLKELPSPSAFFDLNYLPKD
jgi:NitT/TauT family transport system substrate-binding protein